MMNIKFRSDNHESCICLRLTWLMYWALPATISLLCFKSASVVFRDTTRILLLSGWAPSTSKLIIVWIYRDDQSRRCPAQDYLFVTSISDPTEPSDSVLSSLNTTNRTNSYFMKSLADSTGLLNKNSELTIVHGNIFWSGWICYRFFHLPDSDYSIN